MESHGRLHSLPFASVLVARKPNENPSELEIQIRSQCQKLRVLEKLSGGAHLLLPGSDTIAIRTYNQDTIHQLESALSTRDASIEEINQWHTDPTNSTANHHPKKKDVANEKLDGILSFREYFKYTVVFFILSNPQAQREQLDRSDSFFHRVQYAMTSCTNNHNEASSLLSSSSSCDKVSRVFLVPDAACAVQTLSTMVESLTPAKRKMKQQYFNREALRYFLPPMVEGNNNTSNKGAEHQQKQKQQPSEPNGAVPHITRALHSWGQRFDISPGEMNVMLSVLGNVSNIATADRDVLQHIPIDNTTKEILLQFFGAEQGKEGKQLSQENHHQQEQVAGTSSASSPPRSGIMMQPRSDDSRMTNGRSSFNRSSTSLYASSSHSASGSYTSVGGMNHHQNNRFTIQRQANDSGSIPNTWTDMHYPSHDIHRPPEPLSITGSRANHEMRHTQHHNPQPQQQFLSPYFDDKPPARPPMVHHNHKINIPHISNGPDCNFHSMSSTSSMPQQRRLMPMKSHNQEHRQQPVTFPPQHKNYLHPLQHAQYDHRGAFPGPPRHHQQYY